MIQGKAYWLTLYLIYRMIHNRIGQRRLPIVAMVFIGIVIVGVGYIILQANVNIKEKDIEFFIIAFAAAALGFVWINMKGDNLKMEGV